MPSSRCSSKKFGRAFGPGIRRAAAVALLAAALAGSSAHAEAQSTYARAAIESGAAGEAPAAVYVLAGPEGYEVLAALDQPEDAPERMTLWIGRGDQFRAERVLEGAEDPGIGRLDEPARFLASGQVFLHVPMIILGTGAMHEDWFFRVTPAGTLEAVAFQEPAAAYRRELRPGEGVWKGAFYSFLDEDLTFEFSLWNSDDGNCCPTAGSVTGRMRAEPVPADAAGRWRLVVAEYTRHPPEPDSPR